MTHASKDDYINSLKESLKLLYKKKEEDPDYIYGRLTIDQAIQEKEEQLKGLLQNKKSNSNQTNRTQSVSQTASNETLIRQLKESLEMLRKIPKEDPYPMYGNLKIGEAIKENERLLNELENKRLNNQINIEPKIKVTDPDYSYFMEKQYQSLAPRDPSIDPPQPYKAYNEILRKIKERLNGDNMIDDEEFIEELGRIAYNAGMRTRYEIDTTHTLKPNERNYIIDILQSYVERFKPSIKMPYSSDKGIDTLMSSIFGRKGGSRRRKTRRRKTRRRKTRLRRHTK